MCHQAGETHRMDLMPPIVSAPASSGERMANVGSIISGRPADVRAAAIPLAAAIEVPDGASTFLSWCNSMISTRSKYGAAIAANFSERHGAHGVVRRDHHAHRGRRLFDHPTLFVRQTVVPTTRPLPFAAHHAAEATTPSARRSRRRRRSWRRPRIE